MPSSTCYYNINTTYCCTVVSDGFSSRGLSLAHTQPACTSSIYRISTASIAQPGRTRLQFNAAQVEASRRDTWTGRETKVLLTRTTDHVGYPLGFERENIYQVPGNTYYTALLTRSEAVPAAEIPEPRATGTREGDLPTRMQHGVRIAVVVPLHAPCSHYCYTATLCTS